MSKSDANKELIHLLESGGAHASFDDIVSGYPGKLQGVQHASIPHTAWQLLEHLRIAQSDIVEYTINPEHVSPEFPSGYWPASVAPPNNRAWAKSAAAFKKDLKRMQKLVKDCPDVLKPLPDCRGKTLLSRVLLLADHNAYHLGQLMLLRRAQES